MSAAPSRPPSGFAEDLVREPWRFDILAALRRIERSQPDRPRIGDSATRSEDYVALGEDPFLAFPASTISRADRDASGRLRIFVQFLGLLGPQGPLPLTTTDEAYAWALARDDAFPRFLDLLNHRFLQLFFRAWADARPIAQHDRPADDRFKAYVGSAVGVGSLVFRGLDSVPDEAKLALAGLLAPTAKSASRLRNALSILLGATVEIDSFVGTFLEFEPGDRSRLGQAHARLGADILLGGSVFSIEDKFRIRLFTTGLTHYERLLPNGDQCEKLADFVFFYLGDELDWDVELALPIASVAPMCLGRFGRLGYTTWMTSRGEAPTRPGYRADARFHPAERAASRRTAVPS